MLIPIRVVGLICGLFLLDAFCRHALEELVNDHPGGTSDHSLTETGDGSTGADIAGIMKECAGFLRRELNGSFALHESWSAAAIHRHLIFGRWLQVVQMDRTAKDAADRTHPKAHMQVVGAFAGPFQCFAARKALSNAIRVSQKVPNRRGRKSLECELPLNLHFYAARSIAASTARLA
jgi:hypothetical protein